MKRWLGALLLLLLAGGLFWGATRLAAPEPPPPYREALRESRPLLPLLQKRRGALVQADISVRAPGQPSSPLHRALQRGMHLQIRGQLAQNFSALLFRLRSGEGEATWQEIQTPEGRALVVRGSPYRYPGPFLENRWERALWPFPLLRIWPELPTRAEGATSRGQMWAYPVPRGRFSEELRQRVPLLRALPGQVEVLFSSQTGAPGGFRWKAKTSQTARLLGISQGVGETVWTVSFQVLRWKAGREPALPERLYGRGGAALETALLPFYVGMQE